MPRRLWLLTAGFLVLAAVAGTWQWLASSGIVTPSLLHAAVARLPLLANEAWMPAVLLLLYVTGALVAFPLSVLVAATGLVFGPVTGFAWALAGTLLAAAATYVVGWLVGRDTVRRYGGKSMQRLSAALARRGISTMILVSLLPIAPFTLTSMAAGAFHLRFSDYLLGTVIGIAPGLLAVTVIGSQLGSLLQAGDPGRALIACGVLVPVIAALVILRRYVARPFIRAGPRAAGGSAGTPPRGR